MNTSLLPNLPTAISAQPLALRLNGKNATRTPASVLSRMGLILRAEHVGPSLQIFPTFVTSSRKYPAPRPLFLVRLLFSNDADRIFVVEFQPLGRVLTT